MESMFNSQRASLSHAAGGRYLYLSKVKYVSKLRGQLCDSRKSYIASVTNLPEGRQFHATDKICKKVQEIVYWCGH